MTNIIQEKDFTIINDDAYSIDVSSLGVVNHIITDPPYNISKESRFKYLNRSGIDFGEWDKGFNLLDWLEPYTNLLDKNGSIIIFASYKSISFIMERLEKIGMEIKDLLIWKKSNPMPRNTTRRYVQDAEYAIWAVKKKSKWTFNKPNDKKYLRATFTTAIVSGKEKNGHPTQKSLQLMKDIISIHTNPGDVILDPFMGSGTTGLAALNLDRKFIGIEKEESYYNIAKDRLIK